jgi:hypothetical protein
VSQALALAFHAESSHDSAFVLAQLRHTHIDIDGRNAVYTKHLFGAGQAGGKVDHINTLSQFDKEVAKAYKSDTFKIKRLEGLLDVRKSWNKWLRYKNYGTTKKRSAIAKAQGGRQEDVMCMRFFKSPTNVVLMQYKFMESDKYWLPYNKDGIPVFSKSAPTTPQERLRAPPTAAPCTWPEQEQVHKFLLHESKLSELEKSEWKIFFDNIPTSAEAIQDQKCFKWNISELASKFKAARVQPSQGLAVDLEPRPDQMFEKVIWDEFTQQQWNRDNYERARRHSAEQHATAEKQRSQQLQQQLEDEGTTSSDSSLDEPSSSSDGSEQQVSHTKKRKRPSKRSKSVPKAQASSSSSVPVGEAGVVDVGDIVLFSPDEDSRAIDVANNYTLGINVGRVIKTSPRQGLVQLWWLWGNAWNSSTIWIDWRDKRTKKPYQDEVHVSSLLQASDGMLAKVVMKSKGHEKYTLTKESLAVIQDVLATNENE